MMKWEYKTFEKIFAVSWDDRFGQYEVDKDRYDEWMCSLGAEGWILCSEVASNVDKFRGSHEARFTVMCRRRLYPPPPDFGVDPSQAAF